LPRFTQRITETHGDTTLTIDVTAAGPDDGARQIHREAVAHVIDTEHRAGHLAWPESQSTGIVERTED
jgi:hypothetical protein